MTTDRPTGAPCRSTTRRRLERCAGTQFDPAVVAALIAVVLAEAARRPDFQLTMHPEAALQWTP